jgi:hypothetical protein
MIEAECSEPQKKWVVKRDGEPVGYIERFATGYMLTLESDPPVKIKRFRMIDALRQAFEGEVEIRIDQEPRSDAGTV